MIDSLLSITVMFVLICLYFLPTLIARDRKHKNLGPIMLVNLFLGWSIVMWFVCLVWSMTCNTKKEN